MHRSVMRVLVAVGVFATGGLVWSDLVGAAGKDIDVTSDPAKCDKTWGPPCFTPANGTVTPVTAGDTVTWHVLDGTHTVTPVDPAAFSGSGDLTGPDATFSVTFERVGVFAFYCKKHGSVEDDGKTHHGMWGKIDVRAGDTTTTSAPPPPPPPPPSDPPPGESPPPTKPEPAPPPSTGPAHPPTPPSTSGPPPPPPQSGSNGSNGPNGQTASGTGRPYVGPPPTAPPPTSRPAREAGGSASAPSSTQPPSKAKDTRDTDRSDADYPEATAVPPDEAVLPPSPSFSPPTTAPLAEAPAEVPQGDSVAVLKSESGGDRRRLILFGTMFGVGVFALGVGGWKYAHRASKYWPA